MSIDEKNAIEPTAGITHERHACLACSFAWATGSEAFFVIAFASAESLGIQHHALPTRIQPRMTALPIPTNKSGFI